LRKAFASRDLLAALTRRIGHSAIGRFAKRVFAIRSRRTLGRVNACCARRDALLKGAHFDIATTRCATRFVLGAANAALRTYATAIVARITDFAAPAIDE
jgi:hypothetical protein